VRLQKTLNNDTGAAHAGEEAKLESSSRAATAPRSLSTVLEIVNDNNLVWVSIDEKIWKAK
jgi:hypothetical protein